MDGRLVGSDGEPAEASRQAVQRSLAGGRFFWLDLHGLDEEGVDLLSGVLGYHDLAVEDAQHFGQRPKLEEYESFVVLVVYGVGADGVPVEVHCFYSERCLVTVHQASCPQLPSLADRLRRRGALPDDRALLLHHVVDGLVDSFFPALGTFDDAIDELEDQILEAPTDAQLARLFEMKRSLIALRKVAGPERDLFAGIAGGAYAIPGMTAEAERYFRDVYDHLIRVSDLVDSYRDLLSGAMDTHLATVSNRLNDVMRQLAVIATVFLPLSFITGFFGQNFSWMVGRLSGLPVFVGAGIGLQVLTAVALLA
ncbi:MAG: magnesium transporter CorA family protein, partial [Acidimicrobiales bacterium]